MSKALPNSPYHARCTRCGWYSFGHTRDNVSGRTRDNVSGRTNFRSQNMGVFHLCGRPLLLHTLPYVAYGIPWESYNWNPFLGQLFEPLIAFGHSHTLEFHSEHPSVMESQVMPPVIKPKGLSLQWSQYLFDKVREYVHDPTKMDNVSPRPQEATPASSAGCTS